MCAFRRGGIPSPTCRNYCGTFRVLSSGLLSAIISPSSHHLCLPLLSFALHLFRVSTRRHRLHCPGISSDHRPRRITPLYFYLSIYISPLAHFLPPLYLTHSLSLYISPRPLSIPSSCSLSHYLFLNYPFSHYMFSLSLYFITLCLPHTHSLPSPGPPPPPSPLCSSKIFIAELTSSHLQQLTGYTWMMVSSLYC